MDPSYAFNIYSYMIYIYSLCNCESLVSHIWMMCMYKFDLIRVKRIKHRNIYAIRESIQIRRWTRSTKYALTLYASCVYYWCKYLRPTPTVVNRTYIYVICAWCWCDSTGQECGIHIVYFVFVCNIFMCELSTIRECDRLMESAPQNDNGNNARVAADSRFVYRTYNSLALFLDVCLVLVCSLLECEYLYLDNFCF